MNTYSHINVDEIDDEHRLAYRREIQRKLAEVALTRQRLKELQDEKRAHEQDSEAAADEHSSACEPLQAELKALNEKNVQAILAKKPVSQDVTNRRIEILKSIAEQNERLELRTGENKKNAGKLQREFDSLRMETTSQMALENVLIGIASVGLRDRYACLNNHSEWASRRLKSEQGFIELNHERIAAERAHRNPSQPNIQIYERRLRQHKVLADDAGRECSRLNTELAEMRQQMLDE